MSIEKSGEEVGNVGVNCRTEEGIKAAKVDPQDWIDDCRNSLKDHEAFCKATDNALRKLFVDDSLLCDLHCDVSSEELEAQIAVLNGQAIAVYVERAQLETLKVIVRQSGAKVLDLKRAIKRAYEIEQIRSYNSVAVCGEKTKTALKLSQKNISWRYIWRTYYLSHDSQPLLDDRQSLSSCGIGNKSIVKFMKRSKVNRLREKVDK